MQRIQGGECVRVSVVVATYNAAWCIERALDGALSQSRPPDEIIVGDDGSSDRTADLVERRFGPAVTVLRLPHRNAAAARRIAIERSSGDWLAFLDADDFWLPGKLERQLAFVERHPQLRWLTGDGRLVSAEGVVRESWLADYFDPVVDVVGDLLPPLIERCFPLMSATLVERGACDAVGGIDPEMVCSHDYDLWLRLAARYPGGLMAEPLVEYYSGPGTLSRDYEGRYRDDLALMRRVEKDGLGRGAAIRRAAAERAAALEFDLAIGCVRAGRLSEARMRLRRVLGSGPWNRRLLALAGTLLPAAMVDRVVRYGVMKRVVQRARRVAARLPSPGTGEGAA
jgi:glycosyltransferase involved in cell wall biosynthesis